MSDNLSGLLVASISLDKLRRFVECPICTEVPRDGKMFQCSNSHMICGTCLAKLPRNLCPNGECSYQTPAARVHPIEDIISGNNFVYSCPRAGSGCTFEGPKETMEDHETKSCPLRTFKCPYQRTCNQDVTIRDFGKHMKESHRLKEARVHGNSFNTGFLIERKHFEGTESGSPWSWGIKPHDLPDNEGAFFVFLQKKDRVFHLWVNSVGDLALAEKYSVAIKLSGQEGTNLCWKGRPIPVETPKEAVLGDDKDRLEITWNLLKKFTAQDTKVPTWFEMDVEIRRASTQVKTS